MKYLKLYEVFKVGWRSYDHLDHGIVYTDITEDAKEQSLREICLELEDEGYNIIINRNTNNEGESTLIINKNGDFGALNRLPWNNIRDYLLRVKDYLGDDYIQFLYLGKSWEWEPIELSEDISFEDKNLQSFAIEYKNL